MRKNHTHLAWLSLPVQQSKEDSQLQEVQVQEVVTKLCGVSDPAKCTVKAAGDMIRSVRSEKAFRATLLTLEELRHLSSVIKPGTFTKKQLSIL